MSTTPFLSRPPPPPPQLLPLSPPPLARSPVASAAAAAAAAAASVAKAIEAAVDAADAVAACRPSLTYPALDVYADGTIRQRWSGNVVERIKRAGRWYVHVRDLAEGGGEGEPPVPLTKQVDRIICEAWHGPHSVILHSHLGHVVYLDGNRENLAPANMTWSTIEEAIAANRNAAKRSREKKKAASAAAAAAAAAVPPTPAPATHPRHPGGGMHLPPPKRALSDIASFYDDWADTPPVHNSHHGVAGQDADPDAAADADGEAPAAKRAKIATPHQAAETDQTDDDDDDEDAPLRASQLSPYSLPVPSPPAHSLLAAAAALGTAAAAASHPPRAAAPRAVFRYANPDTSDAVFQMDAARPKVIVGAFHSLNDAVRTMSVRMKRDTVEVGNALLLVLNQPLCQLGGFSWVTPSRLVELHCPPRPAPSASSSSSAATAASALAPAH